MSHRSKRTFTRPTRLVRCVSCSWSRRRRLLWGGSVPLDPCPVCGDETEPADGGPS